MKSNVPVPVGMSESGPRPEHMRPISSSLAAIHLAPSEHLASSRYSADCPVSGFEGGTMEGKNLHEVELIVDGGNRGLGSFGLGGWLGRALATATSFGWADGWWCSRGGWCLFQLLAACFPFVRSDCGANKVVVGWARCLRFGWDAFCC